jgi:hypothetical protein
MFKQITHQYMLRQSGYTVKHTHTSQFYGHFPWVSKAIPQLKWINSQVSAWIPPTFLPASQRQITSTNTCFIRHCPNQSERANLSKSILNYPPSNGHWYSKSECWGKSFPPDAFSDTTLSISRPGTGWTNGSNISRGWGLVTVNGKRMKKNNKITRLHTDKK